MAEKLETQVKLTCKTTYAKSVKLRKNEKNAEQDQQEEHIKM